MKLRIGKLLRARGMSVYALAKAARLPQTTAYRLARGHVKRVDLRLVDRLCTVFECQVADLFERSPDRLPKRGRGKGATS